MLFLSLDLHLSYLLVWNFNLGPVLREFQVLEKRYGEFSWTWEERGPSSIGYTLLALWLCLGVVNQKAPGLVNSHQFKKNVDFSLVGNQALSPIVSEIWGWKYVAVFISKDRYLMFLAVAEHPLLKGCSRESQNRGWKHNSNSEHFRGGSQASNQLLHTSVPVKSWLWILTKKPQTGF